MSRFKFACSCGKRLAAYDWMVGRILSCPKCGRTLTVPTPFKAEDQLNEMIDKGYSADRRKLGRPIEKPSYVLRYALLVILALFLTALMGLVYYYIIL